MGGLPRQRDRAAHPLLHRSEVPGAVAEITQGLPQAGRPLTLEIDRRFMAIPTEFKNVTAVAKANLYFDAKVVSHTILFQDGSKKTLGLIYPGKYHFGTDKAERMEIVAGNCRVKIDGQEGQNAYSAGQL